MNIVSRIIWVIVLVFSLLPSTPVIADGRSQESGKQSSTTANPNKSSTGSAPSAEEIAEAKSKGLVWVNLSTRVYHKSGPLYGNTKRGKFMPEEDAKKAGYRQASENESKTSTPSKGN